MSDIETIFSDLLDSQMSQEAVIEANDRTIPSGSYKLEVIKKDVTSAGDTSPWPGRPMVKVTADAYFKNHEGEYVRRGRITFDMSFKEVRRPENNRLDNQSRLWANLVALVGRDATNRDVLDYLGQYPLTATVSRTFKTVDGKWANPKTDEEARKLMAEGAEPRNFVQTIRGFSG